MIARIVLAREPVFAIGPLMVSPPTRMVSRDGREQVIQPRVMQVLVALARAGGGVVSRDDLLTACWDGRIVGEDAVDRVLGLLRRLAEGLADGLFTIETIPRVGYRLVRSSQVEPVSASSSSPTSVLSEKGAEFGLAISRRNAIALAVGGSALVAGGAAWVIYSRNRPPRPAQAAMDAGLAALRQLTPDQISDAIALFHKAVALAPDFARPWGLLALAYQAQLTLGAPPDQAAVFETRTREAAARALGIDPQNADAQAALAGLRPIYRNWLDSGAALEAGLARHPKAVSMNRLTLNFYSQVGRIHDVQRCAQAGLAQDAQWPSLVTSMVLSNWVLGQLDQADAWMAQAVAQWPRYYGVWFIRQRLLTYTGRAAQALAMIEDLPNRPIGIPDWNFDQCRREAQAMLTKAPGDIAAATAGFEAEAHRGVGFAENAAQFFAEVGMVDRAFDLLGALYYGHGVAMADSRYSIEQGQYASRRERNTWILWMPMSASLRRDPRLATILRDIGLTEYWRRTGTHPDVPVPGL